MKKRFIYFLLTCMLALLPSVMWADTTPYVVLCLGDETGGAYPDATLYFTNRDEMLIEGGNFTPEGSSTPRTITKVWSGTEVTESSPTPLWLSQTIDGTVRCLSPVTSVVFEPSFATVRPTSMARWFGGDISGYTSSLETITGWENLNTSEVTIMWEAFAKCSKLQEIDLSHFDTRNVTHMGSMFRFCSGLESIDLRTFNTSKVRNWAAMFWNCSGLKHLDVSMFEISTETIINGGSETFMSMYGMFRGCSNLTSIDISNFNTSKVDDMQFMFGFCNRLTTIYVGDLWNTSSLTTTGRKNIFYSSGKLVGQAGTSQKGYSQNSVQVSATYAQVDGGPESPGYFTYKNARAVLGANHTLYLTNCSGSIAAGDAFTPAGGGSSVTVDAVWSGDAVLKTANPAWTSQTDITTVVFEPDFAYVRPTTCEGWFNGLTSLATIEGKANLNTTYCTSTKNMFKGTAITSFNTSSDWTHFYTSNVTDMEGMFDGCDDLTAITLDSKFNTSNVTTMANMFNGCSNTSLTAITGLNYFDTSNVTDMSGMFQGCSHISGALDLSHFYTGNVTTMANMFSGDAAITSLDLASFDLAKVTTTAGMFKDCSALTAIYVGLIWDKSGVGTSTDMFDGCTALKGGNNFAYNSSYKDATYAVINDDVTDGYLTEKYPLIVHFYGDRDMSGLLTAYNGQKATVYVHRAFTANQWTTLCLPFSMTEAQISNTFGAGTELKTLTGASRSGANISSITFSAATDIEAGKPYIIKPANAIASEFHLTHKVITATAGSTNAQGVAMRGALTQTTLDAETGATETFYTLADLASVPTVSNLSAVTDETPVNGLKAYFSSTKATTVTVNMRNSDMDTWCCPYDLDFTDVSDLKAYVASYFIPNNDGTCDGVLYYTRIRKVPAGTGVLIVGSKGDYAVPISSTYAVVANMMVGCLERTPLSTSADGTMDGNFIFYFASGNGALKYLLPSKSSNMPANRAYLPIPANQMPPLSAGSVARINFVFDDAEDGTTNIEEVENTGSESEKPVFYNLQGQRVENPTRGIYIVKGKKVYIQ